MKSSTVNLGMLADRSVHPPEMKEEYKKFYKAIGENRRGWFDAHYTAFKKEVLDNLTYSMLPYKMEKNGEMVKIFAYFDHFDKVPSDTDAPEYEMLFCDDNSDMAMFVKV